MTTLPSLDGQPPGMVPVSAFAKGVVLPATADDDEFPRRGTAGRPFAAATARDFARRPVQRCETLRHLTGCGPLGGDAAIIEAPIDAPIEAP